jgi:tRNA-dihydrouridine synthase B
MPIIGNGDLETAEQVVHAFEHYNVDGIMIARASLGKPWLFAQAAAALEGRPVPPDPTIDEQREIMLHHYDLVVERFGAHRGTMLMRKFACCYAQSKPGARHFRAHISRVETQDQFYAVVEKYFPRQSDLDAILETQQAARNASSPDELSREERIGAECAPRDSSDKDGGCGVC